MVSPLYSAAMTSALTPALMAALETLKAVQTRPYVYNQPPIRLVAELLTRGLVRRDREVWEASDGQRRSATHIRLTDEGERVLHTRSAGPTA